MAAATLEAFPEAVVTARVGVGALAVGALQFNGKATVASSLLLTDDKICQSIVPSADELLAVLAKIRYHHVFLVSLPVPANKVSHPTPCQ